MTAERRPLCRGFTLLEVMVALVIVALGMIALHQQLGRYAAGVAFIERLSAEPGFDDILVAGSQSLSQSDPETALELVARIGNTSKKLSAHTNVASMWTRLDPRAAARWAVDIDDPALADQAVRTIALQWASIDIRAAEDWARSVPYGARRDAALTGLLGSPSFNEASPTASPDHALWSAFSDDRARDRAAMQAAQRLASRDPAAARRLIDRHIGDPQMRAQAERALSPQNASGGGFFRPQ